MKTVLLSGGNGRFATYIKKHNSEYKIVSPSAEEMNISSYKNIDNFILKCKPDIFLHAAALTKPMLIHEKQPSKSIRVNILGTANIVLSCMKYDVKLVYVSTDYVYEGKDGNYSEKSKLKPFNKYGWSKLGGECSVMLYDNSLILRVAMINKPFEYKKALADVFRSALYDEDVAKICLKLLNKKGIINVGGKGQSVYEFAKRQKKDINKIYSKDIKDVNMPSDNTLNIDKLNKILNKK